MHFNQTNKVHYFSQFTLTGSLFDFIAFKACRETFNEFQHQQMSMCRQSSPNCYSHDPTKTLAPIQFFGILLHHLFKIDPLWFCFQSDA